VDQLFDTLRGGSNLDPAFDRAVVQDLIALAPPGIDELFALVAVTDALTKEGAEGPTTVVLDTAPTGHALRLLALPEAAREWIQALLAVLLKYRQVVGLGQLAQELVEMSKQLRTLKRCCGIRSAPLSSRSRGRPPSRGWRRSGSCESSAPWASPWPGSSPTP
jgi:arsenite-transporting ATPase